jgi:hypothetical protein
LRGGPWFDGDRRCDDCHQSYDPWEEYTRWREWEDARIDLATDRD